MKIKRLKIEGEEKIKFQLEIFYNDVVITLFDNGSPTKYVSEYSFGDNVGSKEQYVEIIGVLCQTLYNEYLIGKRIQTDILSSLENMDIIKFPDSQ